MSERKEHRRRYNLRLQYIADFEKWLMREPPLWKFWLWRKWRNERPTWKEAEQS